jgi:hypothetical protein
LNSLDLPKPQKIPKEVKVADRNSFDPTQKVYERVKEIRRLYHDPSKKIGNAERDRLETEYASLADGIGEETMAIYDSWDNLNSRLDQAREIYLETLERAKEAQREAVEVMGLDTVVLRQFDKEAVTRFKNCCRERIETARKLKAIEDWIDDDFGEDASSPSKVGIVRRIRKVREILVKKGLIL